MNKKVVYLFTAVVALALIVVLYFVVRPSATVAPTLSVAQALSGTDTAGFARAYVPRTFHWPADHGAHPEFRTEWWYFTGNLETDQGKHYGFQLTFFRNALAAAGAKRKASLAANEAWMAHFTLTDVAGNQFYHAEHFARAGPWARVKASPFTIQLDDWQVASTTPHTFPLLLQATQGDNSLTLQLDSLHPPVLQGDKGLSKKSLRPGNASFYYSHPRLDAKGAVTIGEKIEKVKGLVWMDREWSTSALDSGQVGWDWFSLHLNDGTDVMYYQLRNMDGSASLTSVGMLANAHGKYATLPRASVKLKRTDTWKSPRGGTYPSGWQMEVINEGLALTLTPLVKDQELSATIRYWEGAVQIAGTHKGKPVSGYGYVELTGYADSQARGVVKFR